jgi:hypothetical protein
MQLRIADCAKKGPGNGLFFSAQITAKNVAPLQGERHRFAVPYPRGMYISRTTKLFFTVNDRQNHYPDNNSHNTGPGPVAASGYAHTRIFCQSCKSNPGLTVIEQRVSQQSHILPDRDWQRITCNPCSTLRSTLPPGRCSGGATNRAWKAASLAACIHTVAGPHIRLSVTRGGQDVKHNICRRLSSKKYVPTVYDAMQMEAWKKTEQPAALSQYTGRHVISGRLPQDASIVYHRQLFAASSMGLQLSTADIILTIDCMNATDLDSEQIKTVRGH